MHMYVQQPHKDILTLPTPFHHSLHSTLCWQYIPLLWISTLHSSLHWKQPNSSTVHKTDILCYLILHLENHDMKWKKKKNSDNQMPFTTIGLSLGYNKIKVELKFGDVIGGGKLQWVHCTLWNLIPFVFSKLYWWQINHFFITKPIFSLPSY